MKFKILLSIILFITFKVNAQTGIGTTTPNASAKLDVFANNKGFLPPRVSLIDIYDQTTVPSPATGLLVYCKGDAGLAAGYYFWNGNAWATIATAGGSGSFASSFLRGSRIATQSIAVNGVVAFTNIDNTAGTDISLNTTTGKLTLAAGNTYRLRGAVPNFSAGQRPAFIWYNETTAANIGSATFTYNPGDGAALPASGGMAEVILTPNVSTVVSFRLLSSLSSGSVTVGASADFSTVGSYPWFDVEVISGNSPVTGQSVDYAIASLSATQSISAVSNVIFNTIQGAGITLNSGGFNLIANKTYKLEGSVGGSSTGYIYYAWVDAANAIISGGSIGSVMKAGSAFTDGPQDKAVAFYTPSTNTAVYLRVLSISGTSVAYPVAATPSYSSTWATITQIGSSAIINPWVLSGNDVYNITGEVGIGIATPNTSALLDLTSTNKGFLPPRIALTAKSGNTTPVASPATGLVVYNSATAGANSDAVSPGYYYYNGSVWSRMDPEVWSTGVAITIGGITTAPTKGTPSIDYVRYRNIGGKDYEVEYNYLQTTAGTTGSGDYLFTLPAGLQFDFTSAGQVAYTGSAGYNGIKNRIASSQGDLVVSGFHSSCIVIPYDATRFRIMNNNWGNNTWLIHSPSNYSISDGTYGMKMTFKFKAL